MYEMRARAGQWIIQEGEPGDRLFVVAGLVFVLFLLEYIFILGSFVKIYISCLLE